MLRVTACRLLEGDSLNALGADDMSKNIHIWKMTWPSVPVTLSTPEQGSSWLPEGEVTHAVEVSRKTVKMS